jgi:hypothetical protein
LAIIPRRKVLPNLAIKPKDKCEKISKDHSIFLGYLPAANYYENLGIWNFIFFNLENWTFFIMKNPSNSSKSDFSGQKNSQKLTKKKSLPWKHGTINS